jgi:hypothetical protein
MSRLIFHFRLALHQINVLSENLQFVKEKTIHKVCHSLHLIINYMVYRCPTYCTIYQYTPIRGNPVFVKKNY